MTHLISNTDKVYPCLMCGQAGNIIRESPDPRLKCTACGFMYDASDSLLAKEQGSIPDKPPPEVKEEIQKRDEDAGRLEKSTTSGKPPSVVPRTPSHVFISKDRTVVEFVNKKDLKAKTLKWETSDKTYNLFELTQKQVNANVDIQ